MRRLVFCKGEKNLFNKDTTIGTLLDDDGSIHNQCDVIECAKVLKECDRYASTSKRNCRWFSIVL